MEKRRVSKRRFIELCELCGLMDLIVHKEFDRYGKDSLPYIYDDEVLTMDIECLVKHIREFEEKSGLQVTIHLESTKVEVGEVEIEK